MKNILQSFPRSVRCTHAVRLAPGYPGAVRASSSAKKRLAINQSSILCCAGRCTIFIVTLRNQNEICAFNMRNFRPDISYCLTQFAFKYFSCSAETHLSSACLIKTGNFGRNIIKTVAKKVSGSLFGRSRLPGSAAEESELVFKNTALFENSWRALLFVASCALVLRLNQIDASNGGGRLFINNQPLINELLRASISSSEQPFIVAVLLLKL